jgi:hypothetical protein
MMLEDLSPTHSLDNEPSSTSNNRLSTAAGKPSSVRPFGFLCALVLLVLLWFSTPAGAQSAVTLAWNPVPNPAIAGYRLYLGSSSQNYTNMIDAGNATQQTVPGLHPGATYHFAVTAYDVLGLESAYSSEVAYTVPVTNSPPPVVRISLLNGGVLQVTGIGQPGSTYAVDASQDFLGWTVVATATADGTGVFVARDLAFASFSRRWYRARRIAP